MIKRIVKWNLVPKTVKSLLTFLMITKNILNFEGCKSIILLQDINNDNIFTYSLEI